MIVDNEQEWIERARQGDEAAFSELVALHRQRVFRFCLALLGDAQAADETAQDVFVKLYESLLRFRGESRLATWLYRVALNACVDRRRRFWLTADAPIDTPSSRERPDEAFERQEDAARLYRALSQLPDEFRAALVMRELEERSYAEISEILGISIGTVESRIFRARERLAEILRKAK